MSSLHCERTETHARATTGCDHGSGGIGGGMLVWVDEQYSDDSSVSTIAHGGIHHHDPEGAD
ncbi:MAG: hypothetical protein M3083_00630 [Actinomycetota bacterium]|nr:hypothetical protein [Actinomycetota bacterium]MDQ6945092.1 hypothetical protein [Actinomycetota bacterium]